MLISSITTFLKALVIGASMLIPGLSGGTMAIVLGIYDRLIHSVGTITKKEYFKKNITFLILFLSGACTGIYLFSGVVLSLVEEYEAFCSLFFVGIILGSIPALLKKADIKNVEIKDSIPAISGFSICLLLSIVPSGIFSLSNGLGILNMIIFCIAGILIAVGLVLPGISVSQMLLLLGVLEIVLSAIREKNFALIIPLVLCVGIGILLTTNILEKCLNNHTRTTYLLICGFVIGSAFDAFPDNIKGENILLSTFAFFAGLSLMSLFSWISVKIKTDK